MQALRGAPCTQKCSTSLSGSRQLLLRAPAPIRSRRGSGQRASVVVEANLFSRAVRVIQSYANQIGECTCAEAAQLHCCAVVDTQPQLCTVFAPAVSSAEDPEKLLDQVVNEMQEDLIKMRQASAQVGFRCTSPPACCPCPCQPPELQHYTCMHMPDLFCTPFAVKYLISLHTCMHAHAFQQQLAPTPSTQRTKTMLLQVLAFQQQGWRP
jgi:hypothetical protein